MSDLHLTLEHAHMKQNYNKELCKNHFKMKYAEFHIHTQKDHLCFSKNSPNQTFLISSKVVYFKKHLAYQL